MADLAARLADIRERIANAAHHSGRNAKQVRLVAASKRQTVAAVDQLAGLGVTDFAESQIQEALEKIPQIRSRGLAWHFIGHLQSNKTRHIDGNFTWVHSVDSLKLARRINESVMQSGRSVNLLLQVNVAADPAKNGVLPDALFDLVDSILSAELSSVKLRGLMTIGYRDAGAAETRAGFAALRTLLESAQTRFGTDLTELSMGMSGDYVTAIEEGATMVRIGSGLFGPRT